MATSATQPRARRMLADVIGGIASGAGTLVRASSTLPGLVGAASIAYGLGLIYWPLLFIAAGVFLILLDRRMP